MRSLLRRVGGLRRLLLMTICGACAILFVHSVLTTSARQISEDIAAMSEHSHEHHGEHVENQPTPPSPAPAKPPNPDVPPQKGAPSESPVEKPSPAAKVPEQQKAMASTERHIQRGNVAFGDSLSLCGLRNACKDDEIPMYFYSGKNHDDEPKICVDGRFVIAKSLNDAGRGLNVVVIYPPKKEVVRVAHFDTYAQDSSTLEIFLEQIQPNELIAIVSFDEAATKLSSLAKQLFYELGSGLVQNMKFRASWYFIGQKGISGFTPFEQMNYANNADWAKPIDNRICVPSTLDGLKTHADPMTVTSNDAKRNFCKKYDGYEDFCDDAHIDDAITPAPTIVKDQPWPITKVPMLIIAGLSHNALRLCFETVLRQPGIIRDNVLVTYDENYNEIEALATLFGFKSKAINASSSYMDQYEKALQVAWGFFKDSAEMIVIEEELYLTIDFTHYMDQMLPLLRKEDARITMISAWNDNGFECAASNAEHALRVNDGSVPALGYMITRNFYEDRMANKFQKCCNSRVWESGWSGLLRENESIIVPEVPRVVRRRFDGLGSNPTMVKDMFARPRAFARSFDTGIRDIMQNYAHDDLYRAYLRILLTTALTLDRQAVASCFAPERSTPDLPVSLEAKQPLAIYLKEDATKWLMLQKCFCAYHASSDDGIKTHTSRGKFDHMLRLSLKDHPLLIVSDKSTLFDMKPREYTPI